MGFRDFLKKLNTIGAPAQPAPPPGPPPGPPKKKPLAKKPSASRVIDVHTKKDFYSSLAGESHYQGALRNCEEGERLWLHREPDNPYDPNAISAWNQSKQLIGYIKRDIAADLAEQMDRGQWIEVTIANLTGGTPDKPTIGCNIHITFERLSYRRIPRKQLPTS
jgi:hypothetical protein